MDVKDWINLTFTIIYILQQIIQAIIASYIIYKAYKEITDYYVDLLKLWFYSAYILETIIYFVIIVKENLFEQNHNIIVDLLFDTFSTLWFLTSLIAPTVYWVLMAYYIKKLKEIGENKTHRIVKKEINSFEIKLIVFFVIYFTVYLGLTFAECIIQSHHRCMVMKNGSISYNSSPSICRTQEIMDIILTSIFQLTIIWSLVVSVIFYFILTKLMSKTLFVYYHENKKSLRILMVFNFIYYILQILMNSLFSIIEISRRKYAPYLDYSSMELLVMIIFGLFTCVISISYLVFGVLNTKTINFKLYVATIMYGLRIRNKFEGTSLLIVRYWKALKDEKTQKFHLIIPMCKWSDSNSSHVNRQAE